MREILFRGKRVENGEWVYGCLISPILGSTPIIVQNAYMEDNCSIEFDYEHVDHETVGQFTGLVDKNGKKIFEGDIIKTDNGTTSAVSTVKYGHYEPEMFYDLLEVYLLHRPKQLAFGLFAEGIRGEQFFMVDNPKCIEVIGNIYDNPELVKGE